MRLEDLGALVHRACRHEHLGDKRLAVLEPLADDGHAGHQPFIENPVGVDAFVQRLLDKNLDFLCAAGLDFLGYEGHFHFSVSLRLNKMV